MAKETMTGERTLFRVSFIGGSGSMIEVAVLANDAGEAADSFKRVMGSRIVSVVDMEMYLLELPDEESEEPQELHFYHPRVQRRMKLKDCKGMHSFTP